MTLNDTHDPALTSWVDSANRADADFPIQNLPFAVFRRRGTQEAFRAGVAIGDQIVDLHALRTLRVITGTASDALEAADGPTLNRFMAAGASTWTTLRAALVGLLRSGSSHRATVEPTLVPQAIAEHALPATIGDYTDFYASVHHATAVGRLFRPDNPLLPNYKWVPIAYHGRSSSISVSGGLVRRPHGQLLAPGADKPQLGPSRRLDYEFEIGTFIGVGNTLGSPIAIESAEQHIFGLCLLNDWSARDIQAWEYQPLGPFLAKNFATTISPWIVTMEALAPFRTSWERAAEDPQPLPYLDSASLRSSGAIDMELEAFLETKRMRSDSRPPHRLSRSNFRHSYWTIGQMVAHHTINGCNLSAGDLLGSGTQSGPQPEEAGSLLELTSGGKLPVQLPAGETRTFLEDGDSVIFRAWCERAGRRRIGFGEARATISG
jgi:fumarylacetoacetase